MSISKGSTTIFDFILLIKSAVGTSFGLSKVPTVSFLSSLSASTLLFRALSSLSKLLFSRLSCSEFSKNLIKILIIIMIQL